MHAASWVVLAFWLVLVLCCFGLGIGCDTSSFPGFDAMIGVVHFWIVHIGREFFKRSSLLGLDWRFGLIVLVGLWTGPFHVLLGIRLVHLAHYL